MNTIGALILIAATGASLVVLRRQRTRAAGAVVVGLMVVANGVILARDARVSRGFDKAEAGSSLSDVRRMMGNPRRETDGTISVLGDKKQPNQLVSGCVRELWYVHFWSPSQYAMCFDRNDRLLSKYHYVSY